MSTLLRSISAERQHEIASDLPFTSRVDGAVRGLESWIRSRDFAGFEPFDLMNSPYVGAWARRFPFSLILRQYGRRWAGLRVRRMLRVPVSKNCKALGLMLGGYCDLMRCGEEHRREASYVKSELRRLRSPGEKEFCWGYDWDAISLRAGNMMPAFSPNAVTSVFCASALLDMAEVCGDEEALEMAASAARFFVTRLNRSIDTPSELCFSYTPGDYTRIYNSSALVSAFLARLAAYTGERANLELVSRAMRYLCGQQLSNGGWYYGAARRQRWIDSFHSAYNLDALLEYRNLTGDASTTVAIRNGYEFYKRTFFPQRAPIYYQKRPYPIDIHSCSQAILTFCAFAGEDQHALTRALDVAEWTLDHMQAKDSSFFYQRHRFWTNRTPYMRWGQAWMFKALTRLQREVKSMNVEGGGVGKPCVA